MADDDNNVASIHREALQHLFAPSSSTVTSDVATTCTSADDNANDLEIIFLEERLASLRKRRLQVHSNLKQLEFEQQLRPLSEELTVDYCKTDNDNAVSYQHVLDAPLVIANRSKADAAAKDDGDNTNTANSDSSSSKPPTSTLAERIHHLRKRRRIVGLHRIAGVSIIPVPTDRNVLGIRLDICIMGGVYVAKHFLFFDVCTSISSSSKDDDDSDDYDNNYVPTKQYYLRLNQHTLPPSVALPKMIQQHFGGTALLPLPEGGSLISEDVNVLATVRALVGDIHDACHAHAVRKAGVEYLKTHAVSSSSSSEYKHDHTQQTNHKFCVSALNFPDTYRHVEFELSWTIPANCHHDAIYRKLVVNLDFEEECNPQPTNVEVTTAEQNGTKDAALKQKSIMVLSSMPLWRFFTGLQDESWGAEYDWET